MKQKNKKIILFGTGDLAQIANLYFTRETEYEVCAFTVDRAYIKEKELMGLPVIPFDEAREKYAPDTHEIHVCLIYNDMNRLRAAKCAHAEAMGYKLASYISSHAFVAPTAKIGKHSFIFENNVIQDFVEIGDNAILWSGNHIGHHSVIGDNCFISSHVVVSGHCRIDDNCFLGVNGTLANGTKIGKESWISHGSIMSGDIPPNSFVKSIASAITPLNEAALMRALERARK
jgi:sugar O-acyltransferase (sialic acid O-acetyltransferase NeuD family)